MTYEFSNFGTALLWYVPQYGSVGTTQYKTAGDPQFSNLAAVLTNGSNDSLYYGHSSFDGPYGSSYNVSESDVFGSVSGGNGIDLAGFSIDKIGLHINSFSYSNNYPWDWDFVSPPDSVTGSGNFDLLFYGTPNAVPEPSTCALALAGLGFTGYSMFRRRKRA
jgi:hypothetical protein